jgi:cytochrome bd-type quinol oxidase subunit 1
MEGLFHSEKGAPLAILGQPDMQAQKLQNPFVIPDVLSFLTYRRWHAEIKGSMRIRRTNGPTMFRSCITPITTLLASGLSSSQFWYLHSSRSGADGSMSRGGCFGP